MSSDAHHSRRQRSPKMYMVASDFKVQDHLEGTIRLQRGHLCQQQEGGAHRSSRGDHIWVKVSFINPLGAVTSDYPGALHIYNT